MTRFIALTALVAATAAAESAVPQFVVHQGRLLEGDAPATGQKKLTFAIYEDFVRDPTRPKDPIWKDAYTVKFGVDGVFSVVLGDTAAGELRKPLTLDGIGTDRFLAIEIEGIGELSPRLRLSTSPYSLLSRKSELAADVACVGCVAGEDLADKGVTAAKLADGAVELAKLAASLKNTDGKLDADTLDGKDSAAFAPADIEVKIDAIKTSVGTGLIGKVDGISAAVSGTLGSDVTAIKASVGEGLGAAVAALGTSTLGNNVAAISTSVGSGLGANVAAINTSIGSGLGVTVAAINTSVGSGLGANVAAINTSVGSGLNAAVAGIATKVANAPDVYTKMTALETAINNLRDAMTPSTCASDMVLGGVAGTESAFCIERNERGANTYHQAVKTCGSLGRHVCTQNQFWQGTAMGALNNMCDNWEWVGDRDDANGSGHLQVVIGGNGCTIQSWAWAGQHANGNGNQPFRCCTGTLSAVFR